MHQHGDLGFFCDRNAYVLPHGRQADFFLEPTFAAVWLHDLTFVTFWRHMILYSLPASSPALIWADLGLERERGRDIWHADATNYPQYAQIHT